jgi:hypothetical protein
MSLKFWMGLKAIIVAIFGIGFLLFSKWLGGIYGMNITPEAILLGQLFGTAFIFEAIVLWLTMNFAWPEAQKIVIAVVLSNVIGFIVCLMGTLNNIWNSLGWLSVGLYGVFALVFAYFLFIKKST